MLITALICISFILCSGVMNMRQPNIKLSIILRSQHHSTRLSRIKTYSRDKKHTFQGFNACENGWICKQTFMNDSPEHHLRNVDVLSGVMMLLIWNKFIRTFLLISNYFKRWWIIFSWWIASSCVNGKREMNKSLSFFICNFNKNALVQTKL